MLKNLQMKLQATQQYCYENFCKQIDVLYKMVNSTNDFGVGYIKALEYQLGNIINDIKHSFINKKYKLELYKRAYEVEAILNNKKPNAYFGNKDKNQIDDKAK